MAYLLAYFLSVAFWNTARKKDSRTDNVAVSELNGFSLMPFSEVIIPMMIHGSMS
jgi:hypothetical protein